MTTKNKKDSDTDNKSRDNIFEIMDGIIAQLNRTKKMFIIMILTIMIIPPIAFAVTFALLGPPFPFHDRETVSNSLGSSINPVFGLARMVPFLISIVWLGIGMWQWFVLSKWTKRYQRYKELQKSIDRKLSNEDKGKQK
jgi:hypothetical protein